MREKMGRIKLVGWGFSFGLQLVLPLTHLQHGLFNARLALMVCQIEARSNPLDKPRVDLTMEFSLKALPPEHVVTLSVEVVGGAEPCSQLGVDVGGRRDLDAMGDAIFFGEAAGVKEALGKFAFVGGEA
jgi:hypothetical protein